MATSSPFIQSTHLNTKNKHHPLKFSRLSNTQIANWKTAIVTTIDWVGYRLSIITTPINSAHTNGPSMILISKLFLRTTGYQDLPMFLQIPGLSRTTFSQDTSEAMGTLIIINSLSHQAPTFRLHSITRRRNQYSISLHNLVFQQSQHSPDSGVGVMGVIGVVGTAGTDVWVVRPCKGLPPMFRPGTTCPFNTNCPEKDRTAKYWVTALQGRSFNLNSNSTDHQSNQRNQKVLQTDTTLYIMRKWMVCSADTPLQGFIQHNHFPRQLTVLINCFIIII